MCKFKIGSGASVKRFGKDKEYANDAEEMRPDWWPLFDPCPNAAFAIARFNAGSQGAAFVNVVDPVPFRFRQA